MKTGIVFLSLILLSNMAAAEQATDAYTLTDVIAYGLKNNSKVRSSQVDIEIEAYGVGSARADRMPRLDLTAGATRFHYPTPVTPIYGSATGVVLPAFDTTIYDAGVTFTLPLYRGGRLSRGVEIAEIRKSIAEDVYSMTRQELLYNLESAYYKIIQLEKLVAVNEETVKQLEAHKRDAQLFFRTGAVAKVELLKTETELAHAKQIALISRNAIESAYELLKTLMGIEDMNRKIVLVEGSGMNELTPPLEESMAKAILNRPDYRAAVKRQQLAEARVRLAQGKRLPSLNVTTDYTERSGTDIEFKENWSLGLRLTMPIFEGGAISADVNKAKSELVKAGEDERFLRLQIAREVRDAHLNIENAAQRIEVAGTAIESAKENLRIEQLRYKTGAGTSTDVIDAQMVLLRAEMDYYQALYDKAIAVAYLRKAVGKDITATGVEK